VSSDGISFASAGLPEPDTWWRSIRIAPGNGNRIYVAGLEVVPPGGGGPSSQARLKVSNDGGTVWNDLPVDDFAFGPQPDLFLEGVMPDDPAVLFARVRGARQPVGDDLYRSVDGGQNWQQVLQMGDTITAFAIRADGTVIAGSVQPCDTDPAGAQKGCVRISIDRGASFAPAASEPRMACVGERSDGDLFACGANWEPDMFALGRSSDGMSWTKVMRFSELAGPLDCPAGTLQDECESLVWPSLCVQLGICAAGADAGPDGGSGPNEPGGCCTSSNRGADAVFGLVVLALAAWIPLRRRPPPGS
jgi:hypothetical protein